MKSVSVCVLLPCTNARARACVCTCMAMWCRWPRGKQTAKRSNKRSDTQGFCTWVEITLPTPDPHPLRSPASKSHCTQLLDFLDLGDMKRSSDHPSLFESSTHHVPRTEGARDKFSAMSDHGGNPGSSSGGGDQNALSEGKTSVRSRRDTTGWRSSRGRSSSVMTWSSVEKTPGINPTSDSGPAASRSGSTAAVATPSGKTLGVLPVAGRGRRNVLLFAKSKSRKPGLAQTPTGLFVREQYASVSRGGGSFQSNSSGKW